MSVSLYTFNTALSYPTTWTIQPKDCNVQTKMVACNMKWNTDELNVQKKCLMNLYLYTSETLQIWKKKFSTKLRPWPEVGAMVVSQLATTAIVLTARVYLTVQLHHTNLLLLICSRFCFVPISLSQGCNSPFQHYTQPNKSLWTAKSRKVQRKNGGYEHHNFWRWPRKTAK